MSWTLQMNAFLEDGPHQPEEVVSDVVAWAAAKPVHLRREAVSLKPPAKSELTQWSDPKVGWGVVMAASAEPPAILKKLISKRKAPILRYMKDSPHALSVLQDDRGPVLDIAGSPSGIERGALPYYLLIYGSPEAVPWCLQYILGMRHCVGRVDLEGTQLENYVNAVLNDFAGSRADSYRTLTFAVDQPDITHTLRTVLADPLYARFQLDDERSATSVFLAGDEDGRAATQQSLNEQLAQYPGLIVTSSHGRTAPASNPPEMQRMLGWLVDQNKSAMDPDELLKNWQPNGAIWYAHACCSAGSDDLTIFKGLFPEGTSAYKLIESVAKLGSLTAPFPKALLGAASPARAFIGHVEPTFNWTVRLPKTGQALTDVLVSAIENLNRGEPVAYAFRDRMIQAGSLLTSHDRARSDYINGAQNEEELLRLKLSALDIQSTVILGDPAVALPIRP